MNHQKCKLCLDNDADRVGSHIVPHFLMKRIDNVDKDKGRDKELGFTIGEFETTSYFGRSVQPEKINEVIGDITEERIKNNQNPIVTDNLFCSICEQRLSQIENEYAKTLENIEEDSKIDSGFSFLFWASVLWRLSISKNHGLILKGKEEERLRRILNNHLREKLDQIDLKILKGDSDCNGLFYRLIRCPEYSSKAPTFLFGHPVYCAPYSLIIDEYVLFFYFKKGYVDGLLQSFFGFEMNLRGKPLNHVDSGETKILYSEKAFSNSLNKLVNNLVDRRMDSYDYILDELHKKLGGKGDSMPTELKIEIKKEITSGEMKLGERYTFKQFIMTTYNVLSKYTIKGKPTS